MKVFIQLVVTPAILVGVAASASAQGFVNLDFERAALFVPPTPVGGYGTIHEDPTLLFPGWTIGNTGAGGYTYISYNNQTIDSPGVALIGPSFPNALSLTPLQGSYSAWLNEASINSFFGRPTLSQVGTIPSDARSINFLGVISDGAFSVGGTQLPLFDVGNGRWAADVTPYAGRSVEISFTTLPRPDGAFRTFIVDGIQFSPNVVPEPSIWVLSVLALGSAGLFGGRRRFK